MRTTRKRSIETAKMVVIVAKMASGMVKTKRKLKIRGWTGLGRTFKAREIDS